MRIKLLPATLLLWCYLSQGFAGISFGEPIPVTPEPVAGVFHHLDSAGRRNIAFSGDSIAVVWEDNRDGLPQIYMAIKQREDPSFQPAMIISGGGESYEPAITGVGDGIFVLIWEEAGSVFARTAQTGTRGPSLRLSTNTAGHATIDSRDREIYAAWREQRDAYPAVVVSRIVMESEGGLKAEKSVAVDTQPPVAPQLYPAIAAGEAGIAIAWEDRRAGHTRLLYSHSADGAKFAPPEHLNEFFSNRNQYDRGNGVTRVALATLGDEEVLAAWMDKRRNGRGYSIYAALGYDGGQAYGPNERVQSDDGDELPHYNPSVAGNQQGQFLVAWDDYRKGTSDIWLSTQDEDLDWGEDIAPPAASGPGEQSNPSITMDEQGLVHLVWLTYQEMGGPTRLWYLSGRLALE